MTTKVTLVNAEQNPNGTMQSVLRSLAVLEAVSESQPIGLSKLARQLDLPKPTVSRILRTLQYAGWVAPEGQSGDVSWTITARALSVGANVMNQVDLREIARPIITRLGEQTDENIHLSVPDGHVLVLIDKVYSSRPVQTIAQIGERVPICSTGSGWAYLSRLDEAGLAAFLAEEENNTSTVAPPIDRDELLAGLATVREHGYAINRGRWRPDVASVASAVTDRSGRPVAALSISMPTYRLIPDLEKPYGALVRAATAQLSEHL